MSANLSFNPEIKCLSFICKFQNCMKVEKANCIKVHKILFICISIEENLIIWQISQIHLNLTKTC